MFLLRSDALNVLSTSSSKKSALSDTGFADSGRQDRGIGTAFKIDVSPAASTSTASIYYNM